jgi:hypothetical protein
MYIPTALFNDIDKTRLNTMQRNDKTINDIDINFYKILAKKIIPQTFQAALARNLDEEKSDLKDLMYNYYSCAYHLINAVALKKESFLGLGASSVCFEDTKRTHINLALAILYNMCALVVEPNFDEAKKSLVDLVEHVDKDILIKTIHHMLDNKLDYISFNWDNVKAKYYIKFDKNQSFDVQEKKQLLLYCLDKQSLFGQKFWEKRPILGLFGNDCNMERGKLNEIKSKLRHLIMPTTVLNFFVHVNSKSKNNSNSDLSIFPSDITQKIQLIYANLPQEQQEQINKLSLVKK